jgi:hypothetical protein
VIRPVAPGMPIDFGRGGVMSYVPRARIHPESDDLFHDRQHAAADGENFARVM